MTPTRIPCPRDGAALCTRGDGRCECPRCGQVRDVWEVAR